MHTASPPSPSHIHSRTTLDFQLSLPEGRIVLDIFDYDSIGSSLDSALDFLLAGSGFTVSISRLAIIDANFFHYLRLEKGTATYFQHTRGTLKRGAARSICAKILRLLPSVKRRTLERLRFDPLTRSFKNVKI